MSKFLRTAASAAIVTALAAGVAGGAAANTLYFQMNPNFSAGPRQAFIFGAADSSGTVIGAGGFNQSFNLGASGFATIDVPINQELGTGVVENKGFRITSESNLSAYFLSRAPATTDMTYLIDGSRLGTDYVVAGYRNILNDQMSVQATVDNTVVTFAPKGAASFSVTLNAGQTYLYSAAAELTGSRITSTNPISVFSGNQCTNVPSGASACDHLVEQMPSTDLLSTKYLVAQTARTGTNGNVLRVVATEDATEVRVNGALVATLNAGQFYEGRVAGGQEIDATKKVLVAQYLVSSTAAGGAVTDPAMTIVPGQDQWLKSYVFAAPSGSANFPTDVVSIIIKTSDLGTLNLDGLLADTSGFNALATTAFSFGNIDVSLKTGPFSISAASPFQLLLSGFDDFDSYFTYGGAAFSPGASPPPPPIDPPPPGSQFVFWDGDASGNANNGTIDGGDGVLSAITTNFTESSGGTNAVYGPAPNTIVFGGAPGQVRVNGADGAIVVTGLRFLVDGYRLYGDGIGLSGESTAIEVALGSARIDSVLTGTGALHKTGGGDLVLSATNILGSVSIDGGALVAASDGALGTGVITINDGATLASLGSLRTLSNAIVTTGGGSIRAGTVAGDRFILSGVISGPGSISQVGFGNLVLNGANTFTNLGINNGTVTLGTNTAAGIGAIAINNGAVLAAGVSGLVVANAIQTTGNGTIDSGAGTFTLSGAIDGEGTLTKIGTGRLILTGNSPLPGGTFVNQGRLQVDGSLAKSTVTVRSGASLAGIGTVGRVIALTGSTIAPGAGGIGTLNVAGAYSQAAGSTYEVELLSTGASDRIAIKGAATLTPGAIANVTKLDAARYVLGTRYTILTTTDGLTGTYQVTGNTRVSQFINVLGTYDAKNAYLDVTKNIAFNTAGTTPNQRAAATGVDAAGNGAVYQAVAYLQTAAEAAAAFDQLSGEIHASMGNAAFEDSRFIREGVTNHLISDGADVRRGMWFHSYGSWGHVDGDGNAARFNRDIGGFFIGGDFINNETMTLGIVGGYGSADVRVDARNSRASTDDWHLGAYGDFKAGGFGVRVGGDHMWRNITTNRTVAFTGFSDALSAKYQQRLFQAFADVGYKIGLGGATVEPFGALAYVKISSDAIQERGGSAALSSAQGVSDDYLLTTLGGRLGVAVGGFALKATAGWRHASGGDRNTPVTLRFASGPAFDIAGPPIARDVAALGLTVGGTLGRDIDFDIGYSGQAGQGLSDHGVRGSIRYRF